MQNDKVFLAPYREIADRAREVCAEQGLNGWIIDYGSLESGVAKARDYAAKGAKVLVSRSVSAITMMHSVTIPVVEIEMGTYDIIMALAKAASFAKKVGILGLQQVIYDSATLGQLLGMEIHELVVSRFDEINPAIDKAKAMGLEALVAGQTSIEYANSIGLPGILLDSSKRSISAALRRAEQIVALRQEEERRNANLNTILDFSYEGIMVIDHEDRVILINKTAQQMLGVSKSIVMGTPCETILPFIDWRGIKRFGKESIGNICKVGKKNLIHNITPVVVDGEAIGMVMTFQYAQNIETLESKIRKELHLRGYVASYSFDHIVSNTSHMKALIAEAKKFASVDSNILITGPTGTGKELFAQSIHNASARAKRPFVAINCASIPANLLESELFGYEAGAFTGASKTGKKGYFELADSGTLFLDEIGEIPIHLQAHLLRVLQEKEIMRVGGDKMIPVDVRIITATHHDLYRSVKDGTFRHDLYHRLNVLRLVLPELAQRREDIPDLIHLFMRQKAAALSIPPARLHADAVDQMANYPWEGNIRELENAVERLLVLKSGEDVPAWELANLLDDIIAPTADAARPTPLAMWTGGWSGTLEEIEREIVKQVFFECDRNRQLTCEKLAISPTTLWRRLKESGIVR